MRKGLVLVSIGANHVTEVAAAKSNPAEASRAPGGGGGTQPQNGPATTTINGVKFKLMTRRQISPAILIISLAQVAVVWLAAEIPSRTELLSGHWPRRALFAVSRK